MNPQQKREAQIKEKAKWFAQCIRISGNIPSEIPRELDGFFNDSNEMARFERYLVHQGLFKRSDDKWSIKF